MLPKKHRLSKTAEVSKTTAKGRAFFSQSFLIKYLISKEIDSPLVTVIVSNKISKSAVIRNKLKRAIRSTFQEMLPKLKPAQYAVIVKKGAISKSVVELKEETLSALQKGKMINI